MTEVAPPPAEVVEPRRLSDTAWATRRAPSIAYPIIGAVPGGAIGLLLGLFFLDSEWLGLLPAVILGLISSGYTTWHAWSFICTQCGAALPRKAAMCPGCHATIRGSVTEKDLRRLAEEDLDRRVAEEMDYEECPDCRPEQPCERHPLEEMTFEDFEEL